MGEYDRLKAQKDAIVAKQKPKPPSQPWVDAADLREDHNCITAKGQTAYFWRDTDITLIIDDETNEIVNIEE